MIISAGRMEDWPGPHATSSRLSLPPPPMPSPASLCPQAAPPFQCMAYRHKHRPPPPPSLPPSLPVQDSPTNKSRCTPKAMEQIKASPSTFVLSRGLPPTFLRRSRALRRRPAKKPKRCLRLPLLAPSQARPPQLCPRGKALLPPPPPPPPPLAPHLWGPDLALAERS